MYMYVKRKDTHVPVYRQFVDIVCDQETRVTHPVQVSNHWARGIALTRVYVVLKHSVLQVKYQVTTELGIGTVGEKWKR